MPTRILIVGAGAIGAFFGSRLATAPQVLVSALCRGNYSAVKRQGFKITSPWYGDYTFKPECVFSSPTEAVRLTREKAIKWDYLLVATKVLPEVSDDSALLEGLVGDGTSIVLMKNGLGIEEAYRKRFPQSTILSGVTIASAVQPEPGLIQHNRWSRTSVGPYTPRSSSQNNSEDERTSGGDIRTREFVELLKQGGIKDAIAYDFAGLQFVRWHKVAINCAMNASSVLSGGCGNAALANDRELAVHIHGVMDEVLAAAPEVIGQEIPWKELKLATPDQVIESVKKNTSGSRPSMWHDWENGRKMELEAILGNPIRLAKEKGVDMPRVQSMYALLRMAQEKREMEGKGKL